MNDTDEERITFSDEEWAIMLADPAFGYICQARLHRIDRYHEMQGWDGSCPACECEAEAAYYEYLDGLEEDAGFPLELPTTTNDEEEPF